MQQALAIIRQLDSEGRLPHHRKGMIGLFEQMIAGMQK
jgi:hypothetical protein